MVSEFSDDHDVVDFSVYSLFNESPRTATGAQLPQEERQKYDAEFQRQMNEYEQERQKLVLLYNLALLELPFVPLERSKNKTSYGSI